MPNKNFDAIKKRVKTAKTVAPRVSSSLTANRVQKRLSRGGAPARPASFSFIWNKTYLLTAVVVVVAFIAFASGMGFALETPKSDAESSIPPVPAGMVANLGDAPVAATATSAAASLSSSDIFNMPLEVLQTYFQNPSASNLALEQRKVKLQQFLADHHSPLVDVSDTIAEQPHWQLILAISFSESTLGKSCYNFNCSGIGGATNIKSYKSFANWILDFNRLLDQKYNNWTLDEMCGVYVKPCTNNWLDASSQILNELKQDNIN